MSSISTCNLVRRTPSPVRGIQNARVTAVRTLWEEILENLNLRNVVIDFYFQKTQLSENLHDEILAMESNRDRNEAFLEEVLQSDNIDVFIEALDFRNTHKNLASKIKELIQTLTLSGHRSRPARINPDCSTMRRMILFNFKLREKTSKGRDCEQMLLHITSSMKQMCKKEPDIFFHMLDAEVAFYRVFYKQDGFQKQDSLLNKMELLINRTKYPDVSQMVYFARKGSYLASKGDIDTGMMYLADAEALSDKIHPCKESGMMRYVYVNLLLQLYKQRPTRDTKQQIIRLIIHSIRYDFAAVASKQVREDYIKMMYLKLAFCVLGIGCFCEIISDCTVDDEDHRMAQECLSRVDDLPGQLYNKHRMFYAFTKSLLEFRSNNKSQALQLAMSAFYLAKESKFNKELENIHVYMESLYGNGIQEENIS